MTIDEIRDLVLEGRYNYSQKIRESIEDGWYGEEDLEQCILTGCISKTERDELKTSVDGKKHVILGRDTCGCPFYTCGKAIKDEEGKLYFFITGHKTK
ncbi:MAG TPA: hypothetical protein VMT62_10100 [Syntrophorhabdaceae bacterium]|nr:hypothetical protein [Syntrophorhabdaceae bacterium]